MPVIRVGLIGFGSIGAELFRRLRVAGDTGLEPAFVHVRGDAGARGVPPAMVLRDLDRVAERRADLVVEAAHPDLTRN